MKIEKNIPVPDRLSRLDRDKYVVVDSMEVGDSILCKTSILNSLYYRANSRNLKNTYATRKETDTHSRLWRTK